jgi:hypothetical protein
MYLMELKIQRKNPDDALRMSHLWNTKCSGILSSSILMFVNSTLCQIVKSRIPHCYFPILPSSLFLFANFTFAKLWSLHCPKFIFPVCQLSLLPNCKVKIAQFWSQHCQLCILKLRIAHYYFAILSNYQVHFTFWTARMSFKLPKSDILAQHGEWPNELASCPSLIFLLNLGKVDNELPSLLLYGVMYKRSSVFYWIS